MRKIMFILAVGGLAVFVTIPAESNPTTLRALAPQTSIGRVWHTTEEGGWSGTWTRRGDSMVFDAVWLSGSQKVTGVLTMTVQGSTVRIQSRQQSNGNDTDYEGTLAQDGRSVAGTSWFTGQSSRWSWKATIDL